MDSTDSIIQQLANHTSCDASDGLCKLGHPHGGLLPGLTMWSPERQCGPTKIVGPAYTVEYVSKADPAPKYPGHYIDDVPAGSVLFISSPAGTINAVYGGLMSNRAQYRGAVGTIIDGKFRDVQEHRDISFPVFAREIGTAPPHGEVKVKAVNVPVKFQHSELDVTINPGDYLIADANGVVLIPKDLVQDVLPLMRKQVEADDKVMEEIRRGMSVVEAFKKHRG